MPEFLLPATALYAGLNVLIMVVLGVLVSLTRLRTEVDLGDQGDRRMLKAIRAHGNNAEYMPVALILIGILELAAAPLWLVHALGIALTAGRLLHPLGLYRTAGRSAGRVLGMAFTWAVLTIAAFGCLYYALA